MNVSYSVYDPNNQGWDVTLLLENNYISFKVCFWLSFDDVSELIKSKKQTDSYEAYLDKVEILDSCFQRGEPVLFYTLKYKVFPSPDTYPSQYQIVGKSVDVKDLVSNKMLMQVDCSSVVSEINRSPAYKIKDIQSPWKNKKYEVIEKEEKKQWKEQKEKLIEIKINIDLDENYINNYYPLYSWTLCFGDDDSFVSYFDVLFFPLTYVKLNVLRVGLGNDGQYSVLSYAFSLEAFLPLTNCCSVYAQGNWSLNSYKYKKGYFSDYQTRSGGLYSVGLRLSAGEKTMGINLNFGYGVEFQREIKKDMALPMRKVFYFGVGLGAKYKKLFPF